jgi:2,4-dienoyl-CoA reductase-like NADH-dependent reductase (Old Yellow Enzyme family)
LEKPQLFTELELRNLNLKNRVVVSPMCQYMAIDGHVQDWHIGHHARFAFGGPALSFVEATGVTPEGRITHGCTGIWDDSHVAGFRNIVDLYKSQNIAVGIQIGHAGRKASAVRPWDGAQPIPETAIEESPWERIAPSAIPEQDGYPVPRSMSHQDILELVEAFASAAKRALDAGFDTIEIHGAHGYLIHSFFSPISNRRNDQYGGDLRRRMTVPLMITEAIRAIWPEDMPLFFRVSAVDNVAGGVTIEDTVELSKELKIHGIDVIDCSSGGMLGPATPSRAKLARGYQVPYAEQIKVDANVNTMAVGLIIEPEQAEAILINKQADLIALAREMMSDSNWTYHAALKLGHENPYDILPPSYAFHLQRRAGILNVDSNINIMT